MDASPRGSLGFPRSRRIKQGRDFSRLRLAGRRVVHGCLILNWAAAATMGDSRLGVITGRKIGNAVVRSRARRLLREAYRLHQLELNRPVDLVLVARASIAASGFATVERDFLGALRKARLCGDGAPPSSPQNPGTAA